MQFNREGVQNVKNWCYKVGGLSPFSILIFRTLASGSVLDSNLDLNIYIYILVGTASQTVPWRWIMRNQKAYKLKNAKL